LGDLQSRGVQIVTISADSTADLRRLCQSQGFTYTFLSDPKTEVIRRYGVLHPRGGPDGHDIARPAEFLVDRTGTIRWVNLTDDLKVRARPEAVLKALDALVVDSK